MMQSLPKMFERLTSKIDVLRHALELSSAIESEEYNTLAIQVDKEMNAVLRELHLLKIETQSEKENLLQQQMIMRCENFKEHLGYTFSNLPAKLPHHSKPSVEAIKDQPQVIENRKPANNVCLTDCEYLRLLTTEQFESVPKYIKGRLNYDKVNAVIEKLNGVYVEKYKILKQKKKGMDELNRKRCEAYRSQENKDTKGVHFIVDKDIEDFSNLKMDKTVRNILTMLRHCGLMHEIRGDRHVRYACYSY